MIFFVDKSEVKVKHLILVKLWQINLTIYLKIIKGKIKMSTGTNEQQFQILKIVIYWHCVHYL